MKTMSKMIASIALTTVFGAAANASVIQCGDKYRTASLGDADACYTQTLGSTVKTGDLTSIIGGNWTQVGELKANGSNLWLSVNGSGWGSGLASGTWTITSDFWKTYGSALITMHVGGGQKDAVDNFEWIVGEDEVSGSWSYSKLLGKGGGLSNIKLWGTGVPRVTVPEPAGMMLVFLGLLSLGIARRKSC